MKAPELDLVQVKRKWRKTKNGWTVCIGPACGRPDASTSVCKKRRVYHTGGHAYATTMMYSLSNHQTWWEWPRSSTTLHKCRSYGKTYQSRSCNNSDLKWTRSLKWKWLNFCKHVILEKSNSWRGDIECNQGHKRKYMCVDIKDLHIICKSWNYTFSMQ